MVNKFNKERHEKPSGMVKEALDEYIFVIGKMLDYRKTDRVVWTDYPINGTLGYPSAILLFVIVDTIGSHYRNSNKPLDILIDGQVKNISKEGYQHFYILNSHYFGLNLSDKDISQFYSMGRNKLLHNSMIGKEMTLTARSQLSFLEVDTNPGKGKYIVHLMGFYNACVKAVEMFKEDIEIIFDNGKTGRSFPVNNKA